MAAGIAGVLILAIGAAVFWWLRPAARPNVLLITIDTLRADHVGAYGDRDASTPALDRLAARGTLFTTVICQAPLTLPSHASMLTGLTPPAHGIRDNAGFVLPPTVPTLAEQFRKAGYATAAFVSGYVLNHRFGLDRGFDVYDDRMPRGDPARPFVERRADATIGAASAWLTRAGTDGRATFAWVHLFDPHAPYDPPEPYRTQFADRPYDGEIAFADSQIDLLLAGLDRTGRLSNTIVVALSDHGEGLGEHGEETHGLLIYDSTVRIPLVFAGPGIRAGLRIKNVARAMDVGPTLLDLAGIAPLERAQGRSLAPAVRGQALRSEDAYVESLFARLSFGWAALFGWRSEHTMFIDAPRPELYDMQTDPDQLHDLSGSRAADVARYRQLTRAVASTGGPGRRASPSTEVRERLSSLGYTSAAAADGIGPLRNPRDFAALASRIEHAITIETSDPAVAAAELRSALEADPSNTAARQHLVVALSKMRRFDEAIAEGQPLVAVQDASADTFVLLGDIYRLAGRPDAALEAFGRAAALDRGAVDPLNGRGRTLVALGRREEARQAFGAVLALAPDDAEALEALADLALERGDIAEALARLEALHAGPARQPASDLKLGVVLVRTGNLDRAIALFREVAEMDPGNADALVDLGGALAKAGRAAEAIPCFERAVAAGTRSPVVWNSLGFARLETGNRVGAAEAFRRSLAVRADQPQIVDALRQLEGR